MNYERHDALRHQQAREEMIRIRAPKGNVSAAIAECRRLNMQTEPMGIPELALEIAKAIEQNWGGCAEWPATQRMMVARTVEDVLRLHTTRP